MNNKILLSIVFPTFERDITIELALKSILVNIPVDIQEHVEILVFDNNSKDLTKEKVKKLIAANQHLSHFKLIENETNIGFDLNHYKAYTSAKADFIWFCSDRYIYNVNIKTIIDIIQNARDLGAITFSTFFRKNDANAIDAVNKVGTIDKMYDIVSMTSFGPLFKEYNLTRCYEFSNSALITGGINYYKSSRLTSNVSDSIVRVYRDREWLKRLKEYNGTFMLVLTTLIKPYSDVNYNTVAINLPYFTKPFMRIDIKTGRHLNRMICYGHLMQQEDFPIIGKKNLITILQLRTIFNMRVHNIAMGSNGINTIEVDDIYKFCDFAGFKLPWLLNKWICIFKLPHLPQFMLKPIILINKIVFKLYESFQVYKESK